MNSFAVYHQCYKNEKATNFAIENFRKHNPDVPYYLISDGGLNFEHLAKKYNCIYVHDENNTGLNYLPKDRAQRMIERIKTFFNTVNTEYGLYMEDDVYCVNKIELKRPFNIWMLPQRNNKLSVYRTILQYNQKPNVDWFGGCGGTIWNRNIFVEQRYIDIINDFFQNNYNSCCGTIDELIPTLYLICGLECEGSEFLSDANATGDAFNERYKLIHAYKKMY